MRSAFSLYDANGDGYISMDEMVCYLQSVYRLLYSMKPSVAEELQVGPKELAVATATQGGGHILGVAHTREFRHRTHTFYLK